MLSLRQGIRTLRGFQPRRSGHIFTPLEDPPEKKWKKRWDEVQERIRDSQTISEEFELNQHQFSWFPGHMYKASKEMEEMVLRPDISLVLEIRDSRVRSLIP